MNYMKQVAQMLGVELEEEFNIRFDKQVYKFTEHGLLSYSKENQNWIRTYGLLEKLLTGLTEVIKMPKPILDEVEIRYLSEIIKPFRKQVISIGKLDSGDYECIVIKYRNINGYTNTMCFPYFEKGTIYKGMEIGKRYSLSELGL